MSIDLKKYVPDYLKEIKEFSALYDVSSYELNKILDEFNDIFLQTRISTATWGLDFWEEIFGLTINHNLPIEERRQALIAKKIGQGTTTVQRIKEVAKSYTGGTVEVIENPSDYSFIVKFTDVKGIPTNVELLKNSIETIKPAHLAYTIQYFYNAWSMLKTTENRTWGYYSSKTWEEVKIF